MVSGQHGRVSRLVGVLALVLLSAVACGSGGSDDDVVPDVPVSSTAAATTSVDTSAGDSARSLSTGPVDPGVYELSTLGTRVTFATADPWTAAVVETGVVILDDPEGSGFADFGAESETLVLARPTGFLSEADVRAGYVDVTGPTSDLDAWIDLVDFEVAARDVVVVGGRDADRVDGRMRRSSDTFLRTGTPVPYNGTADGDYIYMRTTQVYRIWVVDQGAFDPIVAIAMADEGDAAWLERAERVVETMSFGEPAEHPNPPTVDAAVCSVGGADLIGDLTFDAAVDIALSTDEPIDGGTGFAFSTRLEVTRASSPSVRFDVLGPVLAEPDFETAGSSLERIILDLPVSAEPELSAFGLTAVGAVIDVADGPPNGTLGNVPLEDGPSGIRAGDAFWFFDTPHGVYAVVASGSSDLDASLELLRAVGPTLQLVDGACG